MVLAAEFTKKMRQKFAFALLLAGVFFAAQMGFAQVDLGTISGTVTDQSGAVVPDASVTLKSQSSNVQRSASTNGAGGFTFPGLPIGSYDLSIAKDGFKTSEEKGVKSIINSTNSLTIALAPGGAGETVTVEANAPQIETGTSEIGTVVPERAVEELPLTLGSQEMRTPFTFIFLAPGAVGPGTAGQGNYGFNQSGGYQTKISGGQNFGDEVLLDGGSTYRQAAGETFDGLAPSIEALTEFKIITSTLPAQYGRTSGGLTTFSTKSGTNEYHGKAYEIFQNTVLDANNWFNKAYLSQCAPGDEACRSANQRTRLDENDYGVTAGGPISIPGLFDGRNKLLGFFSFEQFRKAQGTTVTASVPIQAWRNGDFSNFLGAPLTNPDGSPMMNPCTGQQIIQGQIFDPTTTRSAGGVLCRTPFANNQIPTGRFSQVAQAALKYDPLPNTGTGINQNYRFTDSEPIVQTTWTTRVDWNATEKSHFYFSYTDRDNSNPAGAVNIPTLADPGFYVQYQPTHYFRGGWDYILSPTLLNHLNLAVTRQSTIQNSRAVNAGFDPTSLGLTNVQGLGFPIFGIGEGLTQLGQTTRDGQIDSSGQITDSVNWQKGRHSLQFGIDYRYDTFSNNDTSAEGGRYYFARTETAVENNSLLTTDTGNSFASFMLGATDNGNATIRASAPLWIQLYGALWLQDDFKVSKNLTLNLGVRWDVDTPRYARQGSQSNFSPTALNTGAQGSDTPGAIVFAGSGAGRNGDRTETWANVEMKDFAPRLGFAYSPTSTTAFRGGYGIYYAPLIAADFGSGPNTAGFAIYPAFSSKDGFDPAFALDSGLPSYPEPPTFDPSQSNYGSVAYIEKGDGRPGMVQNWTMQVQQQLASDLIFTLGYVGQHSTRLNATLRNPNNLDPKYFTLGNLLNDQAGSAEAQAAGIKLPYSTFDPTRPVAQSLRPFPQYYGISGTGYGQPYESMGQATYNSLQATLVRQFRQGLHVQLSYTWSKTLTDSDSAIPYLSASGSNGAIQNPFYLKGEKALSIQDTPHVFVASYIYELPFGRGKHWLGHANGFTNQLVGGWQIGGIDRYQIGQPLNTPCAPGIPSWDNCVRFNIGVKDQRSIINKNFFHQHINPIDESSQRFLVGSCVPSADGSNPCSTIQNSPFVDPNLNRGTGAYQLGSSPRVFGGRIPNFYDESFSFIKHFPIHENINAEFRGEMFNAFNRHIFGGPYDTNPNDPNNYGFIGTTQDAPRVVQFHLQINY